MLIRPKTIMLSSCIKASHSRSFKLSLRLDEHIEVQEANYENGLLTIQLQRIVPEEKAPRRNSNWYRKNFYLKPETENTAVLVINALNKKSTA
jgi:hypothetical protein